MKKPFFIIPIILLLLPLQLSAQPIQVGENIHIDIGLNDTPLTEPHLAINPTDSDHMVVGTIVVPGGDSFSEEQRIATMVTFDGGNTWQRRDFDNIRADPWIVITKTGSVVLAALESGSLVVYRSSDGGLNWVKTHDFGRWRDHPTMVYDQSDSPSSGNIYIGASGSAGRTQLGTKMDFGTFYVSTDDGRTFKESEYILVHNLNFNLLQPVVLSDGTILQSIYDFQDNSNNFRSGGILERKRAWVVKSKDQGKTFKPPLFYITEHCGIGMGFPSLVSDQSESPYQDRIYWVCSVPDNQGVWVFHSSAKGEKWSKGIRLGNNAENDNPFTQTPVVAVNNEGVVGVAWYDRRHDAQNRKQDIYFAASLDGGETFLPEVKVTSVASSPYTKGNAAADRWEAGGEYFGIDADSEGVFHLVWPDSRTGVYQLYSSKIIVGQ